MEEQITNIQNCARCGKNHINIKLSPLDNHDRYTHFAMCPTNGQPILTIVVKSIS